MKIEDIDVDSAINSVKELLGKEKDLSPALKSALEVLLILVTLLLNRMTLNSKNSSKPPSTDSNRKKFSKNEKTKVGNLEPEGVLFIPAADSPIGVPLVVVSHEFSTSTTLYRVDEVQ